MKVFQKEFGCKASVVAGAEITPEMLAKINGFALRELSADEIYVRKFLFCHSAIDRDNERFPVPLLEQFASTFPGKSFIAVHNRQSLPLGLFFDASTEAMPAEKFKTLTREEPRLPEGETTVTVVWAWSYMLIKHREEIADNIDAGVYRHVSIGFSATDMRPVKKEINGPVLFWEYVEPGETREGSLVYLGAQPGATTQKSLKDQETILDKGDKAMKLIVAMLAGLGMKAITETATEEQIAAGIKQLSDEKDARITALETEKAALTEDADLGKAFKEKTISDYVALKHKLGEVGAEPEKHTAMKAVAAGLPFAFLQEEVKSLQKRVEEKFPAGYQLDGEDGEAKRSKDAEVDNPLIPKAEK